MRPVNRNLLLAACVALPMSTMAAPLSYNYVDLEYYDAKISGTSVNNDGVSIGGSAQITEGLFMAGSYADASDIERLSLGVGVNFSLARESSLYGLISYEDVDVKRGAAGRDDNGFGLELGLRQAATAQLEINGAVQYLDVSRVRTFDSEFGLAVGALYSFTERLGVKASYNWVDDYKALTVGGRMSF